MTTMQTYIVTSDMGERRWQADDADHAREQHVLAFPDEPILDVKHDRFREEMWLMFDAEDDEDPSHTACITQTDRGYRVGWWHEDVGLVTDVDFDTLEDAHAWLERAGYADYTS